jgi:hypothetical protein
MNKFINLFLTRVKKESNYSEEFLNSVLNNSFELVSELIKPGTNEKLNALFIGKVQSGKTLNYLSLMANALDNTFDVIIVISGSTGELYEQNLVRLNDIFGNVQSPDTFFDDDNIDVDIVRGESVEDELGKKTKTNKIIIQVMKQTVHLENLKKNIEIFRENQNRDINFLIIDDEGDYGSLDGNAANDKKDEYTRWHEQILNLKTSLNAALVIVTATPYAHYLLSDTNNFKPNVIKKTISGKNYNGLETFHIDDTYLGIINRDDVKADVAKGDGISKELKKAFLHFVSAILVSFQENAESNRKQMIIHTDRKNNVHNKIQTELNKYRETIIKSMREDNFQIEKIELLEDINRSLVELGCPKIEASNKEAINKCIKIIEKININVLNQKSPTRKALKQVNDISFDIYIGANLLDRGVTFGNLICTYIIRDAKTNNADTLLQRARWFGYRERLLKYIKIFLTNELKESYEMIANMEIMLDNRLEEYLNHKIDINQFLDHLTFITSQNMRPTRGNIAKTTTHMISMPSKWYRQSSYAKTSFDECAWYDNIKSKASDTTIGDRSFPVYTCDINTMVKSLENTNVDMDAILKKINYDKEAWDILKAENGQMNVIFMDNIDGELSVRSDIEFQLFSRSKTVEFSNNVYVGDSSMYKYSINKNSSVFMIYNMKVANQEMLGYALYPNIKNWSDLKKTTKK